MSDFDDNLLISDVIESYHPSIVNSPDASTPEGMLLCMKNSKKKDAGLTVCNKNGSCRAAAPAASQATPRTEEGSQCNGRYSTRSQLVQYHSCSEREQFSTSQGLHADADEAISSIRLNDAKKIHGDDNNAKPTASRENDQPHTTLSLKRHHKSRGDAKESSAVVLPVVELSSAAPQEQSPFHCATHEMTAIELLDDLFAVTKYATDDSVSEPSNGPTPPETNATCVPKPSSLVSNTGLMIVTCGRKNNSKWEGNICYERALASHAELYHQSDKVGQKIIVVLLERQFHYQHHKNHRWCPMESQGIRKKIRKDFRSSKKTDTCSITGQDTSNIRKTRRSNHGPVDTVTTLIAGCVDDRMDRSPPRQKRKLKATNLHLENYQHPTAPKRKHSVRTSVYCNSPRGQSTSDGVVRTGFRQKVTEKTTKIVVYCGQTGGIKKELGNCEYVDRVNAGRLPFLKACESQRTKMVESYINYFDFQRNNNRRNVWQSADEDWSRLKVRKAFMETRRNMPVPTVDPDVQRLERHPSIPPAMTSQHLHRFANSEYPYIEELAFHYFSGRDEVNCEAEPLQPPSPIPEAPKDGDVTWTFDDLSRVYLADFSRVDYASEVHKRFLGELMERDDITVVCEGLLGLVQNEQEFLDSVGRSFRNDPHHKFRRFERREQDGDVSYHEVDGYVTMKVSDFLAYLRILKGEGETTSSFVVYDQTGKSETISADKACSHVFYMIDVDMPKMLVRINEEYKRNFKIKEILPGGAWCMMNNLPKQTRPFMGPNCYITPGGGYTQMHQDGHGTVDSGHSNVRGFNEVVMLRRLPECHKRSACREVPSFTKCRAEIMAQNMLYKLPHDDGRQDRPNWPTHETVNAWRAKNYCPSVFILKEGQHVLINKGRLHAFRKLTIDSLPENDCHASLRRDLIQQKDLKQSPLCISIAFDWMFAGITAEGMNREAASTLECTSLCRDNKCKSLAIPKTAILKLASLLPTEIDHRQQEEYVFKKVKIMDSEFRPKWKDIARGILPSLRHIIRHEDKTVYGKISNRRSQGGPDSILDCSRTAIDPFGNDYFCKLCDHELPNTYYHCEGCEMLLSKDFNICSLCFEEKKYLKNKQMQEGNAELHPNRDHVGKPLALCSCDTPASQCHHCSNCMTCCACICHTVFSKRSRFFSAMDLKELLHNTEALVESDEIEYARETEFRLDRVALVAENSTDLESTNGGRKLSSLVDVSSSEETPTSSLDGLSQCATNTRRYSDNGKRRHFIDNEKGSSVDAESMTKSPKGSVLRAPTERSTIFDVSVSSYSTPWRSVSIAEENWNDTDLVLSLKSIA